MCVYMYTYVYMYIKILVCYMNWKARAEAGKLLRNLLWET